MFDANASERIGDLDFSPNELTFSLKDPAAEARIILNQNWSRGWTSTAGTIAIPRQTELGSVTVPPGQSGRYTFTFRPPLLVTGLVIFDLALIATLVMWRRQTEPLIS